MTMSTKRLPQGAPLPPRPQVLAHLMRSQTSPAGVTAHKHVTQQVYLAG